MKINFQGLALGSFLGAMLIGFSGCKKSADTTKVIEQSISESVYASGIVKAAGQYEVFAAGNGIIKSILVKEGDSVAKDSPLFIIDNAISAYNSENARIAMELSKEQTGPSSNTLLELEGRLKLAREKMLNDSVLLVRQNNLWAQKVGSKQDQERRELAYKSSTTEYHSVLLQYNQMKSELEKKYRQSVNTFEISKKQQSDFIIKSNLNGLVYDILKEPGEFITTQTPIAIVGAAGQFEIELQVDEFDIVKIKKDQRVFITMDSYHDKVFESVVMRVEPIMNSRTRTFTVYANFVNLPEVLYPNLTVEANILIRKNDNSLTIPAAYLMHDNRVLTAPEETTQVTTGITNMQWVEIVKGLQKDQEIYLPLQ